MFEASPSSSLTLTFVSSSHSSSSSHARSTFWPFRPWAPRSSRSAVRVFPTRRFLSFWSRSISTSTISSCRSFSSRSTSSRSMDLARSSLSMPRREKTLTSTTVPSMPGRHRERRVPNVPRLLAEDGAEELLLGRELRLALGRDLADQDVAGLDLRAVPHDPRLVEVLERLLGHVRDVARDVFLAQLRVARLDLELLDVDRGVAVVLHEPLGDQDRVLEVVAAPGHEGDEDVPPERQLALVGAGAVRDHLADGHPLALPDDRPLVDARVLVRPPILRQVVDLQRPVVHRVGSSCRGLPPGSRRGRR